jgi:hypothetical protein
MNRLFAMLGLRVWSENSPDLNPAESIGAIVKSGAEEILEDFGRRKTFSGLRPSREKNNFFADCLCHFGENLR